MEMKKETERFCILGVYFCVLSQLISYITEMEHN